MKTVKEVLERKNRPYNFISPDALVYEALQSLNAVNLSYLVVMDGDQFKGIFSERDYTRNVILKGRASNTTKVAEVMSTDLPVIDVHDTVEQCMNKIDTYRTRYLLAYADKHFEGVITIHDLLRMVIASKSDVFDDTMAQRLIDHHEDNRIY
ncbi:MAG: CBS domain-containing protein [Terrimonas sp.]|nr:CBS domain-containing protein [Terrimonas sp.]